MRSGPSGGTTGGASGQYYKHPKGTRWAYFPKLPPGFGKSKGWIRVGSPTYNKIHRYNVGGRPGPHGTTVPHQAFHPAKITTAQWNPASPQGRQQFLNRAANNGEQGNDSGKAARGGRVPVRGVPPKGSPGHSGASKGISQNRKAMGPGYNGGGGGKKGKGKVESQNYRGVGNQIGSANVGQMIDQGYANDLAGMQYDPQIHNLQTQLAQLPAQQAQNQADIGNWMAQVAHLNNQAGQRAGQMGQDLSQNQGNITASLMAALGGGGNAANSMVGANGSNQAALFAGLGANAQQYSADMAPFLALQESGMKQAQMASGTQQTMDYQRQLADLQGQRGQAKTDAILKIIDANNSLSQQRFANKLSKLQAQSGVASLMGDLALKGAQTADTRAHTNAMNQQAGQANGKHTFVSYEVGQRDQIIRSAVAANDQGRATRNLQQAMKYLKGAGFDAHSSAIQNMLSPYYVRKGGSWIPR